MLPENRLAELGQPKLVVLPSAQALTEIAWQQLLDYVSRGGCLLVTGPVERDEHWQRVDRLSPLGAKASLQTIDVRQSELRLPGEAPVDVSFGPTVQKLPLDVLRFADGKSVEAITHGQGRILWAADPVEFAENYAPAAALYRYALKTADVPAPFTQLAPLSPGVLAFPTVLDGAVLYSFSNESLDDQPIHLKDAVTGANIDFRLPSQRGAALLLRRPDGRVLAAYGAAGEQAK